MTKWRSFSFTMKSHAIYFYRIGQRYIDKYACAKTYLRCTGWVYGLVDKGNGNLFKFLDILTVIPNFVLSPREKFLFLLVSRSCCCCFTGLTRHCWVGLTWIAWHCNLENNFKFFRHAQLVVAARSKCAALRSLKTWQQMMYDMRACGLHFGSSRAV